MKNKKTWAAPNDDAAHGYGFKSNLAYRRLFLVFFKGADAHAVPVGLGEHIAHALSLGRDALGSNLVFLNKDLLHSLCTCLGNLGVDFGAALGGSVALDAYGSLVICIIVCL